MFKPDQTASVVVPRERLARLRRDRLAVPTDPDAVVICLKCIY